MSSIRLTLEEINTILHGGVIERVGGPSLKIHAHVGKERDPDVPGKVSDGYHTFDELYEHRIFLYIKICEMIHAICEEAGGQCFCPVWRSERHSDGSRIPGWFVLGINEERGKQITYHLPMRYWDNAKFAKKRDRAPEFDGHTSSDVLTRISKL